MKRLFIAALCLLQLSLCACSNDMNRRELDEINLIHIMGIDYSDGMYVLTAVFSSGQGADPEKNPSGSEDVSEGKGATPFEAFQDLKLKNKKTVSIASTGYFLIGETAAAEGIETCLDFLSRDETVKMESLVFITQGVNASYFISEGMKNGKMIHEDLEAVEQKLHELVTRIDNTLVNILNEMEDDLSGLLIPYLKTGEDSFNIGGYAVFDGLSLADYLDIDTSAGINIIKNIMRTYPIYLKKGVSLSVSSLKSRMKTELEEGLVWVDIHVDFESMVREVNTDEDIFRVEEQNTLTRLQNAYIEDILKKAVDYSKDTGRDILNIGRIIRNRYAKEWSGIRDEWKDMVPDIQYELHVRSRIAKSFILGNRR